MAHGQNADRPHQTSDLTKRGAGHGGIDKSADNKRRVRRTNRHKSKQETNFNTDSWLMENTDG